MAESVNSQSLSAVTEGHDDRIKTAETEQHLTEQAKYPQHKQIKLQQNNNKNYNQERTSSSNGSSSSPTILQSHLKSSSSKSAASTSSGSKRTHSKSRITPRKETRTGTERTTDNISPNSCNRSSSRSTLNNNSGSIPVASSSVIDDQPNTTQSAVSLGLRTNTATNLTDSTTKYTAQQKEHNEFIFNSEDNRYYCNKCNRHYGHKASVKRHARRDHILYSYECRKDTLSTHLKMHDRDESGAKRRPRPDKKREREVNGHSTPSSTTLGSINSANILLQPAIMSLENSETTISEAVGDQFSSFTSTNCTGVNSDEFQPAENMLSQLSMDKIAWAQEFAAIPTAYKNAKDKSNDENDFDVQSNHNSSVFGRDPNFSMGRFINQRLESLENRFGSRSPERTPKGNTKVVDLPSDVDVTPHIDNRTYIINSDEDIVSPHLIDLLKKPKRNKSHKNMPIAGKESSTNANMRDAIELQRSMAQPRLTPNEINTHYISPSTCTRFDHQWSERDFIAGSPHSIVSADLRAPPVSPAAGSIDNDNNARRLCENGLAQMRGKTQNTTTTTGILQRMSASPAAREASSAKSVVPKRTNSAFSLKSGNGGNAGGVIRSASRCSSSCEFSHRDGNRILLKATAVALSWGSTRLRSAAHKTMQVKNTAAKKLTLRVDVHGPGYQLVNMPGNNTLTLQSQEFRTVAVSFCPTVIGAALGKLSFYALSLAPNSVSTSRMPSILDIPLYGYGGHCSIVAQVHIPPVGMAFLQMGYLHELSQPMQHTISIYNKGPLLGFALFSIASVLPLPHLCTDFKIQPAAMLIPPGTTATLHVVFRPKRQDARIITRLTKTVLTLANLRLISGDEANRQRMRQLVARMSTAERAKVTSSKSLEPLWEKLPGEQAIEELQTFKESPESTIDLLTHMRIDEVALTINANYFDETIKSTSSSYFLDEDETVLFRTVCSPSPSNVDGLAQVLEQTHSSDNSSSRSETCRWSVMPSALTFYLNGESRKLCSPLFICNSFLSRQYIEVSTNRKNLLRLTPSEGYIEPDGGHLVVEVRLLPDKLTPDNRQEAMHVTVSLENERITVPVKLCGDHLP